jgi:hypothetical protein
LIAFFPGSFPRIVLASYRRHVTGFSRHDWGGAE